MTTTPEPTPDDQPDDVLSQAEAIVEGAASSVTDPTDGDEQGADDALSQAETKAAEHLADLQRLQAEYVNYRKRVDRDRAAAADLTTARLVESLIPVLDDIAAARDHGDLTEGPFASIAEKLEEILARTGWERYGSTGDVFDPTVHEALVSQPSADVTEPTIAEVAQSGHRLGDRVLRPARVVVSQPE